MDAREAATWKKHWLNERIDWTNRQINYGTFADFLTQVNKDFKPIDKERDAMDKLGWLKQGNRDVEEYVTDFTSLARDAGLEMTSKSDNKHMIKIFRVGLNPKLANRILFRDNVPTTLQGWINKVIQFDVNFRNSMADIGKPLNRKGNKDKFGKFTPNWKNKNNNNKRDPNAMDVDSLTTKEQSEIIRKGLCFKCREPGHLARDCKKKKSPNTSNSKPADTTSKHFTPEEIHAMLMDMNDKEKEEYFELAADF